MVIGNHHQWMLKREEKAFIEQQSHPISMLALFKGTFKDI